MQCSNQVASYSLLSSVASLFTVLKEAVLSLNCIHLAKGSPTPKNGCTDFEISGFHLKISLIFHKISLYS